MKKLIPCIFIMTLLLCGFSFGTAAAQKEVRGVWVSSVLNLDYPFSGTTSAAVLKKEADDILDQCVEMGMNTVYLQVRPASDALYASSVYPWSKYLTGTQGVAPENGFDPLTYWVAAAHNRGIALQAWINPYRAAMTEKDFKALADNHPAKLHPAWVFEANGRYYFDPGIAQVRQMVVDGVTEILDHYDVDGIHLDDYFYPGSGGSYDDTTFANAPRGFADKGDWRRDNNDLLIQALHHVSSSRGKSFGVSPAGIWANKSSNALGSATKGNQTYYSAYADTRKWVKEGWLDYICPQIYWEIGDPIADYQILAHWWADVTNGTDVDLYIGMADYRYPTTASSGWKSLNIIRQQLALNAAIPEIKGEVHFRFGSLMDYLPLKNLYLSVYKNDNTPLPRLVSAAQEHTAYMVGNNGKFFPDDGLTRGEIAVMLSQLIVDKNGSRLFEQGQTYQSEFSDVKASTWYGNAVGFMAQQGLLAGYTDGTFRPNAKITRSECASMVSRFFLQDSSKTMAFRDVPEKHWAYLEIANGKANGYMVGYSDGTFRPDQNISRSEAVTLVNGILGRNPVKVYFDANAGLNPYGDVKPSSWAYYEIMEASVTHLAH